MLDTLLPLTDVLGLLRPSVGSVAVPEALLELALIVGLVGPVVEAVSLAVALLPLADVVVVLLEEALTLAVLLALLPLAFVVRKDGLAPGLCATLRERLLLVGRSGFRCSGFLLGKSVSITLLLPGLAFRLDVLSARERKDSERD